MDFQRCRLHKTVNALNRLTKSVQPKVKADLHDIWMAETHHAFGRTLKHFEPQYTKAMAWLAKDRDELPVFHDYSAEYWVHSRANNPIESTFARVRLRSKHSRNCGFRTTTLAIRCSSCARALKSDGRARSWSLSLARSNSQDGEQVTDLSDRNKALITTHRI